MIVDLDDFCEDNHRLDLLEQLHDLNPAFRCTLFAIPGRGSDGFWDSVPEWCELAVHGWLHPHPREAEQWTYDQALAVMLSCHERFVEGFKAPGWQISDDTYRALRDHNWWVADHWMNDGRRPEGLRAHVIHPDFRNRPEHWHGHIGDSCGNGIAETFDELGYRVAAAWDFQLISEVRGVKAPEAFQSQWELDHLLAIVDRLDPQRILEVGAMYGGTLWHWLQHAVVSVVVVDDEMRRAAEWHEWEEHFGPDLYLVQGRSQDEDVIAKARALGPYDFAFIDGDHTFESARSDFDSYAPLAKVVAFHDILPRPGYGVSELWAMLKVQPGARYIEIAQNETLPGNEGPCGIGVLWT